MATLEDHRRRLAELRRTERPRIPKPTPKGICQADVLMVLNSGVDDAWLKIRGDFPCERIRNLGITASWCQNKNQIAAFIEHGGAQVVINRAFAVDVPLTESLANRYPHVKFVSCCHSSQSYLMYGTAGSLKNQNAFMRLARDYDNCYYATVDERNLPALSGCSRCIVMPNAVKDIDEHPPAERPSRVVSLIGRMDMIKNWPNQIIGAAIAHHENPLQLLVMVRGDSSPLVEMAKLFRVPTDVRPWSDWQAYMAIINNDVSLGLQVSFSESFNYVALEHMLCGVPVVGSSALRYLPEPWKVDCDTPRDIGKAINWLLERDESARARRVASAYAHQVNKGFDDAICRLLG